LHTMPTSLSSNLNCRIRPPCAHEC
jgi:hypothetical protein